jgi:dihydroorotate dehydrogenase (NAD+) catalytic subunit
LAGASAVQVGSAVGDGWIGVFAEINDGIANYMKRKGFSKISEMVGLAKCY